MKVFFLHCSIIFFLEFCIADGHPLNPRRGQKYWRNHRWAFDRNSFAVNSNRDFVLFVSFNLSCRNFFFSRELFANNSCIIMGFGSCNRRCWPTLHCTISVLTSADCDNFGGLIKFSSPARLSCWVLLVGSWGSINERCWIAWVSFTVAIFPWFPLALSADLLDMWHFIKAVFGDQQRMTELKESVVELLVKKLGVEKEEVEKAHTSFLDKHPEGHMTRLVLQQKTNALTGW